MTTSRHNSTPIPPKESRPEKSLGSWISRIIIRQLFVLLFPVSCPFLFSCFPSVSCLFPSISRPLFLSVSVLFPIYFLSISCLFSVLSPVLFPVLYFPILLSSPLPCPFSSSLPFICLSLTTACHPDRLTARSPENPSRLRPPGWLGALLETRRSTKTRCRSADAETKPISTAAGSAQNRRPAQPTWIVPRRMGQSAVEDQHVELTDVWWLVSGLTALHPPVLFSLSLSLLSCSL